MSGFENYRQEMARIDREIRHLAAICGLDPADGVALAQARIEHQPPQTPDPAWENLRGLLILRQLVEAEMIEIGLVPPPADAAPGRGGA